MSRATTPRRPCARAGTGSPDSSAAYDHVRGGNATCQQAASKSRNGMERGSPNHHLGRLSFAWKSVRGLCYKDAWTTKSSTQRWPEASMPHARVDRMVVMRDSPEYPDKVI